MDAQKLPNKNMFLQFLKAQKLVAKKTAKVKQQMPN